MAYYDSSRTKEQFESAIENYLKNGCRIDIVVNSSIPDDFFISLQYIQDRFEQAVSDKNKLFLKYSKNGNIYTFFPDKLGKYHLSSSFSNQDILVDSISVYSITIPEEEE